MFKIMQTNQYEGIYNIVFTYKDECFLAAGEYENNQIQLTILDAIDHEDITENYAYLEQPFKLKLFTSLVP